MQPAERQIKLEENLRDGLLNDPSSENFSRTYDRFHRFVLKHGFPREGRKEKGFLYASEGYLNLASETIFKLVKEGSKVLEIGAGDGQLSFRLSKEKNCQVTATDVSPVALKVASQKSHPCLVFKQADARNLPFFNEEFRFVISKDVLEHLPPEDHSRHLREVIRVLKKGGRYLLYTPPRIALAGEGGLHLKQYSLKGLLGLAKMFSQKISVYWVQPAKIGLCLKIPKFLWWIVYLNELILEKTRAYKLGCLNKVLVLRFVLQIEK